MTPLQPIYFSQFGAQPRHLVLGVRRDNLLGVGGVQRMASVSTSPVPTPPQVKEKLEWSQQLIPGGVRAWSPRGRGAGGTLGMQIRDSCRLGYRTRGGGGSGVDQCK